MGSVTVLNTKLEDLPVNYVAYIHQSSFTNVHAVAANINVFQFK